MNSDNMDNFIDALRNDSKLAKDFAKAVSDVARDNGHEITEDDVLDYFAGEDAPSRRPLPDDEPRATTMAVGEEGGRYATDGIGEEHYRGRPAPSVTLAIGEEDKPRTPPRTGVTSAAIGEEGGKPVPPSPPRRVTTMAVGEEGKKPRF